VGIELKITADSVADLNNQMALLLNGAPIVVDLKAAAPGDTATIDATKLATRKAKKPKADKADAGNAPAPEATSEATSESSNGAAGETSTTSTTATTTASPSEDEPTIVYADVQKAVNGLAAAKGRDAVIKILNDFGVDHATKLKEEQWADVVAEMQQAKEAA
jgi:hypothetical protein